MGYNRRNKTTFSGKISNNIKNNYTRVLKGHIAVVGAI